MGNPPRFHELTDMPDNGASTSAAAGMFTRQDSLALAASLQQRDRERNPVDFMETQLDLDNYLQCFTDLDVPADNVDLNDAELQKANILYDDDSYEQPQLNPYERHVAYGPGFRNPGEYEEQDGYKMNFEVKTEEEKKPETMKTSKTMTTRRAIKRPSCYDDYQEEGETSLSDNDESVDDSYYKPKSSKKTAAAVPNFVPKTKARKYNLKPDKEKVEPIYKLKRARNNDAVRKSRNKAKELQLQKDEEYDEMKKRITQLEAELQSEREGRERDQQLIKQLIREKESTSKGPRKSSRNALESFNKSSY